MQYRTVLLHHTIAEVTVLPELLQIFSLEHSEREQTYCARAWSCMCAPSYTAFCRAYIGTQDRVVFRAQIRDLNDTQGETLDFAANCDDTPNLDEGGALPSWSFLLAVLKRVGLADAATVLASILGSVSECAAWQNVVDHSHPYDAIRCVAVSGAVRRG